jgi:hypothetical protein
MWRHQAGYSKRFARPPHTRSHQELGIRLPMRYRAPASSWRFAAVLAWTVIVAHLTGCATLSTEYDFDKTNDFARYRTFAWMTSDPVMDVRGDTARASALNRRRIVEAVEAELVAKGFSKVADRASANFVVDYTVGARDRIEVESYPIEYRRPWKWGWPYHWRDVNVRIYTEGRLAIDIFDGGSRQPVWHGVGKKRITESDIKRAEREIPAAVQAILAPFPP